MVLFPNGTARPARIERRIMNRYKDTPAATKLRGVFNQTQYLNIITQTTDIDIREIKTKETNQTGKSAKQALTITVLISLLE